jgi:hypothetical protein
LPQVTAHVNDNYAKTMFQHQLQQQGKLAVTQAVLRGGNSSFQGARALITLNE